MVTDIYGAFALLVYACGAVWFVAVTDGDRWFRDHPVGRAAFVLTWPLWLLWGWGRKLLRAAGLLRRLP